MVNYVEKVQSRTLLSSILGLDETYYAHPLTFSPVVRFESVRLDVCTAYLYGKLDEEVYMRQPEGFIARGQESKVIKLQRALYGLKQAGLAWWKELTQSIRSTPNPTSMA